MVQVGLTVSKKDTYEEGGAYEPLKYWTGRGWPERALVEESEPGDKWEHPKFGMLYRVPVVYKAETHTTTTEAQLALLQKSRKRALRRAVSDESASAKALRSVAEAAAPSLQPEEPAGGADGESEEPDESSEESDSSSSTSSSSHRKKKKGKKNKKNKKGKKGKKNKKKDKGEPASPGPVPKAQAKAEAQAGARAKAAAEKQAKKDKELATKMIPRITKALQGLQSTMGKAGIQHVPEVTKAPALRLIEEYSSRLRELSKVEKGHKPWSPEFSDFNTKDGKAVEKPVLDLLKALNKHCPR